jgi:putative DNA primase/helicase
MNGQELNDLEVLLNEQEQQEQERNDRYELLQNFISKDEFQIKEIVIKYTQNCFITGLSKEQEVIYYDKKTCLWKYGMIGILYDSIRDLLLSKVNSLISGYVNDDSDDGISYLKKLTNAKEKLKTLKYIKSITENARAKLYNPELLKKLNKMEHLLPINNNKCIDFKELKLINRRREHYFTFNIDVDMTNEQLKNTNNVHINKFISEIMSGDNEMINFLQIISGYMATGEMTMRSIFLFLGKGANGKSLYESLLSKALGQLSKEGDKRILVKHTNKATHSEYLAALENSRLVVVGETDEGEQLNEALIKKITGQDKINIERKGQLQKELAPNSKILCLTNRKLMFDSKQASLIDRFVYVPFDSRFVDFPNKPNEYKRDVNLGPKLLNEYFYEFIAWLSQGANKYYKYSMKSEPIPRPKKMQEETKKYLNELNSVKCFMEESYIRVKEYDTDKKKDVPRVFLDDLYKEYILYYNQNIKGGNMDTKGDFKKKLEEENYKLEKYGKLSVIWVKNSNEEIEDDE